MLVWIVWILWIVLVLSVTSAAMNSILANNVQMNSASMWVDQEYNSTYVSKCQPTCMNSKQISLYFPGVPKV